MATDGGALGVIAGSGMAAIVAGLDVVERVPFAAVEGLGAVTVPGHAGEVCRCRRGDDELLVALGRRHVYEGDARPAYRLVEWLAESGATALVVTSAAGALRASFVPGEMVLVTGIIDLQRRDRAARAPAAHRGGGGRARGLRVDPGLTRALERAAESTRVPLGRGVLACLQGPTYESPAEVGFLRRIGADLATMSSAPDVECANALGIPVASIGLVTNPATGVEASAPGHEEVVEVAAAASGRLALLISQLAFGR